MIITFPNSPFKLHQPFEPAGDQPQAIAKLLEGISDALVLAHINQLAEQNVLTVTPLLFILKFEPF